jgi:hypothetical protein
MRFGGCSCRDETREKSLIVFFLFSVQHGASSHETYVQLARVAPTKLTSRSPLTSTCSLPAYADLLLLLACRTAGLTIQPVQHATNASAQLAQGFRFVNCAFSPSAVVPLRLPN